jgi:cobalt/nickel transport system permease protein
MHIPDGLMSPLVLASGWLLSVGILAFTFSRLKNMEDKKIPLMAVLAAGIFVAQMVNFPIGGGTSGHLIGAALAAILLGPLAATAVITTILIIQCFLFGDGGLTALGLNILNMAVVASLVGYSCYRLAGRAHQKTGVFLASWLSVFIAASVCALELIASSVLSQGAYGIPASLALPTMLGYHTLIGIGEGLITSGIVVYLAQVAPSLLRLNDRTVKNIPEAQLDE